MRQTDDADSVTVTDFNGGSGDGVSDFAFFAFHSLTVFGRRHILRTRSWCVPRP